MRRLVAAFVLAGTMCMSMMVPSASAQIPFGPFPPGGGIESFGFSGNTPFFSTQFLGPGIECQYGAFLNPARAGGGLLGGGLLGGGGAFTIDGVTVISGGGGGIGGVGGINRNNLSPFFTASAFGPVLGPGPCTPPQLASPFFGGIGGIGGVGVLGLTIAQAQAQGLVRVQTVGGVTRVNVPGVGTFTLTAGQTINNTTLAALLGANAGLGGIGGLGLGGVNVVGGGLGGFGLGGVGLGGVGLDGLGLGGVGLGGFGGLGLGGLGGFGGLGGVGFGPGAGFVVGP